MPSGVYERENGWNKKDSDFLKGNYGVLTTKEISIKLNRTELAIRCRAKSLGIKLNKKSWHKLKVKVTNAWTEEEEKRLVKLYKTKSRKEIATILNKTKNQISNKLFQLGITLSEKERKRRLEKTYFKKGFIPWNKNLKGLHFSPDTEFKKGHLPVNTTYDGCIRVRIGHKDRKGRRYKWIRIAKSKWIMLQHYNWLNSGREIPKGYLLACKDGNTLNCEPDNWELITRAENLKRNSPEDFRSLKYRGSDKSMASKISRGDKELTKIIIKNHPELIELKRQQLKLQRGINASKK